MDFVTRSDAARAVLAGLSVALLSLPGCTFIEQERDIALRDVPEPVIATALRELPGLQLEGAELEKEAGAWHYELSGTVAGTPYELEISPDGELLEVDQGSGATEAKAPGR